MEGIERIRSLTKQRSPSNPPATEEVPDLPSTATNGNEHHLEEDENEDTKEDTRQPNSPLLTSHRASTSSLDNVELDNISLDEDAKTEKAESQKGECLFIYYESRMLISRS